MKNVRMFAYLSLLLFSLMSSVCFGKDHLLSVIETNADDRSFKLYVVTDENDNAKEIVLRTIGKNEEKRFDVKNLKQGLVMIVKSGFDIVKLQSSDFEVDRGGHIKMDYLYDGRGGGKRRLKEFEGALDPNGWHMYSEGVQVKKLYLAANKILWKVIGIKGVQVNP